MRSCDRVEERVCTKRRKNLSLVQRRERESKRVCSRVDEEGIYLAVKITIDCTSIFCRKERWKEENGTRLSISL